MATISNLTKVASDAEVTAADVVPIASAQNGDDRGLTLAKLVAWLQNNLSFADGESVQQYAAPSTAGFNITVLQPDTWLIITPVSLIATGTITLPSVRDNQQWVQVSTSNTISALTVVGSGASVVGAPVGLLVGGFFTMAYDETTNSWFRVA
jgi:hypothetical protein